MEHGTRGDSVDAQGFRGLKAWQYADKLAVDVFLQFHRNPKVPPWLAQQITRAAVSVPANISEGYSRGSLRDYLRFLDIARGSLGELEYYLRFAGAVGLVERSALSALTATASDTARLLFGLIKGLSKKEQDGSWDHRRAVHEPGVEYLVDELPESRAVHIRGG
jgi:four helix bundle protein